MALGRTKRSTQNTGSEVIVSRCRELRWRRAWEEAALAGVPRTRPGEALRENRGKGPHQPMGIRSKSWIPGLSLWGAGNGAEQPRLTSIGSRAGATHSSFCKAVSGALATTPQVRQVLLALQSTNHLRTACGGHGKQRGQGESQAAVGTAALQGKGEGG